MVYWFKLSESAKRKKDIMSGIEPSPIHLYEESAKIVDDFYTNEFSDWWALCDGYNSEPTDFNSKEEAEKAYYTNEGEEIYCIIHDC